MLFDSRWVVPMEEINEMATQDRFRCVKAYHVGVTTRLCNRISK